MTQIAVKNPIAAMNPIVVLKKIVQLKIAIILQVVRLVVDKIKVGILHAQLYPILLLSFQ